MKFPRSVDPAWIEFVKSNPCIACGRRGPSDAHHIRTGQGAHERAGDHLAIPLCKTCHQTGDKPWEPSFHGTPDLFRMRFGSEIHLLDLWLSRAHGALCAAINAKETARC